MGKPNNVKEAIDLVDMILDGSYSKYKAIQSVDDVLNEVENSIDNEPDQDMDELMNDVEDEMVKDGREKQEEKDREIASNMQDMDAPTESKKLSLEQKMKNSVRLLVSEETYREFFKSMLTKWNIKSPSDLDDKKKKEFFNAVDKAWKAKKETD
jgi:hypothetical protein